MTFIKQNLGLSLIALLVPVMLVPVTVLVVLAGVAIGIIAAATALSWATADDFPGARREATRTARAADRSWPTTH